MAALIDADSGTSALHLHSQQARIAAATGNQRAVATALLVADRAATHHGVETEPGVFAFPAGKHAYYASKAFRETGAVEDAIGLAQKLPRHNRCSAAADHVARAAVARNSRPHLLHTPVELGSSYSARSAHS